MRSRASILVALVTCCLIGQAQTSYDVADRIAMIPTPREITIDTEQLDLAAWRIVLADESELCRVGAEEINGRLAALGAKALPVTTTARLGARCIIVGTCNAAQVQRAAAALGVTLTPTSPGEQGYVIACGKLDGAPVVLAGGSDEQGALYACVTLRQMI